ELELLKEDANVYKLIGPVLVKQDLAEANANMKKSWLLWKDAMNTLVFTTMRKDLCIQERRHEEGRMKVGLVCGWVLYVGVVGVVCGFRRGRVWVEWGRFRRWVVRTDGAVSKGRTAWLELNGDREVGAWFRRGVRAWSSVLGFDDGRVVVGIPASLVSVVVRPQAAD
ncbi:hypothetical protein Droror1_Dr00007781, partial [Drosera rotundifolia]